MRKTRECALVILLALLPLSIFAAGKESPQDDGRITLTGQVTDDFGDPLVGVSVFIEGTMTGASTDADGVYTIQVPARPGRRPCPLRVERILMLSAHRELLI